MIYLNFEQTSQQLTRTNNKSMADFAIEDDKIDNNFFVVCYNYTTGNSWGNENHDTYVDKLFETKSKARLMVDIINAHAAWYGWKSNNSVNHRGTKLAKIAELEKFLNDNGVVFDEGSFVVDGYTHCANYNGWFENLNSVDYVVLDVR